MGKITKGKAAAQPPAAQIGESIVLTVTFDGPPGHVISVKAVVREAPQNFFTFNDRGREKDEAAGDNVWTAGIDVVPGYDPGEYNLDIRAFDKNWIPIFLSGTIKGAKGNIASLLITIK